MEGLDWMKLPSSEFPVKEIDEIKLNDGEVADIKKEYPKILNSDFDWSPDLVSGASQILPAYAAYKIVPDAVMERYAFSKYLIDPNKYRFQVVIRIMAIVMRFIKVIQRRLERKHLANCSNISSKNDLSVADVVSGGIILSDNELQRAKDYYYRKASAEIKNFNNMDSYNKISNEKDGILYYTGRIHPTQEVTAITKMTDLCWTSLTKVFMYLLLIAIHQ